MCVHLMYVYVHVHVYVHVCVSASMHGVPLLQFCCGFHTLVELAEAFLRSKVTRPSLNDCCVDHAGLLLWLALRTSFSTRCGVERSGHVLPCALIFWAFVSTDVFPFNYGHTTHRWLDNSLPNDFPNLRWTEARQVLFDTKAEAACHVTLPELRTLRGKWLASWLLMEEILHHN